MGGSISAGTVAQFVRNNHTNHKYQTKNPARKAQIEINNR